MHEFESNSERDNRSGKGDKWFLEIREIGVCSLFSPVFMNGEYFRTRWCGCNCAALLASTPLSTVFPWAVPGFVTRETLVGKSRIRKTGLKMYFVVDDGRSEGRLSATVVSLATASIYPLHWGTPSAQTPSWVSTSVDGAAIYTIYFVVSKLFKHIWLSSSST